MPLRFHRVPDSRVNDGFALLKRVGHWLESKGRRQRISKTSFESYAKWQSEQANFFVSQFDDVDSEMIGIVTLRFETLSQWPRFAQLGNVPMIRGLATDPDHRGQGIGAFAMKQVIETCQSERQDARIYLDCVSDFLPDYYAGLGFEKVDQQILEFPTEGNYDVTLMRLAVS